MTAPIVSAYLLPAAGRRRNDTLIVAGCPFCEQDHVHRGGLGLRQAGCQRGRYYVHSATTRLDDAFDGGTQ